MIAGFDGSSLAQGLSGVGYYTARLLSGLTDRLGRSGLREIVVLANRPVTVPDAPGVRVRASPWRVRAAWMELAVPRALGEARADVAHFTNYTAPLRLGIPYLVSIHDMSLALLPWCYTWKMRLIVPRLLPRVARRARLVLTPSRATRDDVVRLLGIDPGRVRVIPHAAPRGFDPPAAPGGTGEVPYFLVVGNLEPRQNPTATLRPVAPLAPS